MNNFFLFNSDTGNLELNTPEILLVKEFADLFESKRNICELDKKGVYKLKAFRELQYIYLALHWNSPLADLFNRDKHEEALRSSKLTNDEFNDPIFRAACRKFQELQGSNRSIRLMEAARLTVDKFINYFESIDPQERDEQTGKPIYKVKDIMAEITNLNKVHDSLTTLEYQVKKELAEATTLRGNVEDGYQPNF